MSTAPSSTKTLCLSAGCTKTATPGHRGYCRQHNEQRQALHASAPTFTVCERCGAVVSTALLAVHGRSHRGGC